MILGCLCLLLYKFLMPVLAPLVGAAFDARGGGGLPVEVHEAVEGEWADYWINGYLDGWSVGFIRVGLQGPAA